MALIKCLECGKDVSDKASSCPFCGNPIMDKIITIEKTGKCWKFIKLLSWIGVIIGFLMFSNGYQGSGFNSPVTGIGFVLIFFSIIGVIVGKFGAWWYNR